MLDYRSNFFAFIFTFATVAHSSGLKPPGIQSLIMPSMNVRLVTSLQGCYKKRQIVFLSPSLWIIRALCISGLSIDNTVMPLSASIRGFLENMQYFNPPSQTCCWLCFYRHSKILRKGNVRPLFRPKPSWLPQKIWNKILVSHLSKCFLILVCRSLTRIFLKAGCLGAYWLYSIPLLSILLSLLIPEEEVSLDQEKRSAIHIPFLVRNLLIRRFSSIRILKMDRSAFRGKVLKICVLWNVTVKVLYET